LGAFVALALPAAVSAAAPQGRRIPSSRAALVLVRAGHTTQRIAPLRAVPHLAPRGGGANITVTYHGFSTAAKLAFQRAIDILKSRIDSPIMIKVDAYWSPLGASSGILGGAAATSDWLGSDDRVFPVALHEARCGCNANGTEKEISAEFNSSRSDWYLGTDGNTPSDRYDLVSVVLHELIHGVGFANSFGVSGSQGFYGYDDGTPPPVYKDTFDIHVWNQASGGLKLAKAANYANPSAALKAQLTDRSVYHGGPQVLAYRGGSRAKLYAPATWRPGSSLSHFDEKTFPAGTTNALMTPYLANGESIHDPGGLALALLRDRGWTTS
jgi:hypothetical protein